jgi:ribosomal protein S27AE
MTKQIPGFTNDDRSLFIEIIIGIPKIRHYLNTYGKGKNSDSNLAKLSRNLEQVEEYIEHKNEMVTDDARLLRVALVVDSRSPKLYFLPNLDNVSFSTRTTEETRKLARQFREGDAGMSISRLIPDDGSNPCIESTSHLPSQLEKSPIGGRESQPHCPECGSANVKPQSQNRYKCGDCGVRRVESKMVWK